MRFIFAGELGVSQTKETMRWTRGRYAIEMTDEPAYTFGSMDNLYSYRHEFLLDLEHHPSPMHGLQYLIDGEPCGSAVLGASGGATGIYERSCAVLADRCLVAVGDRVAALRMPDLGLIWQAKPDVATCFGLHVAPDELQVVVHGELEISKITVGGQKEWAFFGNDIFTGACGIREGTLVVKDFNGEVYFIDLKTGRGKIAKAR